MADIVFVALSAFAIAGAVAMLINKSPIYSALGLLITMLSIGGLFALLSASFLFMVQIIVYAGAIMTLILFILMFLNIKEEDLPKEPKKYSLIGLGVLLVLPLNILVLKAVANLPEKDLNIVEGNFGDIKPVGMALYNNWLVSFELISILLLVALVGSIVLAKRRKPKENKGEQ
ncbi:NADH-quinone oxidoreductase subunit J [Malaciobacter halophilus]|uniref:NADH-quinone oxidoreductase subunit J n=2 Tax=Malaciobacter halophilus TaxID=197482 RepID=A0A2N1J338_9BACT|nr:NADH-quinone oxidoreductase subunit J [Malaciobacter halophilus]PKI80976.1 NADH-quinone oxidoreductase subunit J [Malaciobacter halophilus]